MEPTAEQKEALALFTAQKSFALNAYAGTGKTSTLVYLAKSTQRRGLYLAFNRAIAQDAKGKFPSNVTVKTSHSVAFHAVRQMGYSTEKMTGSLNANAIASIVESRALQLSDFGLTAIEVAVAVRKVVQRFAHSVERNIDGSHVERLGRLESLSQAQWSRYCRKVIAYAQKLWQLMTDINRNDVFLGHDGYFKLWSLSQPELEYDFILIDEAQDSNAALLTVLSEQSAQTVFAGDRFQQIYQWRGAVNAMESVSTSEAASLTKSFRFGHGIAEVAANILRVLDETVCLTGIDHETQITCSNPDAVLARTNGGLIREITVARDARKSFHIIGGTAELELMLGDVTRLKDGRKASHSEFYGFKDWNEVQVFVQRAADNALSTFVSLVDHYTELKLLEILRENCSQVSHADITFSTVHKAKGLEFDNVVLSEDFSQPLCVEGDDVGRAVNQRGNDVVQVVNDNETYEFLPEEIRILYVAVTRARVQLQLPSWCYTFFNIDDGQANPDMHTRSKTPIKGVVDMKRYAVIDFETSGLSPQSGDRAIEIGIALVENGRIIDSFESLMKSDVRIYPEIEELTGITQKMVARAPQAESVMREAQQFVGDAQLVAHNAAFDKKFWEREVRRASGGSAQHDFLCTLLIARRLFQELPNHRLGTVAAHLGIVNSSHHRALGDAMATAELFIHAKRDIEETYAPAVPVIQFLKKYQTTPKKALSKLHGNANANKISVAKESKKIASEPAEIFLSASSEVRLGTPENVYYKNGKLRGVQVHMHHMLLELEKTIVGRDGSLLEQKVSNQMKAWEKKSVAAKNRARKQQEVGALEQLEEQADEMTKLAQENLQKLNTILKHTLSIDDTIEWESLRDSSTFFVKPAGTDCIVYRADGCPIDCRYVTFTDPQPKPPEIAEEPIRTSFVRTPTFWEKMKFQSTKIADASEQAYQSEQSAWRRQKQLGEDKYTDSLRQWNETASDINRKNEQLYETSQIEARLWKNAWDAHAERASKINKKVDELQSLYGNRDAEAVEEYCTMVLTNSEYPEQFPQNFTVDYIPVERRLIVNYQLPAFEDIEFLDSASLVKRHSEIKEKYLSKTQQKSIYANVVEEVALRTMHELFEADTANALLAIVFNGFVCVIDEAVGHDVTVCIASVQSEKNTFMQIDLARVDTNKCYEHLKGRGNERSYISESKVEKYADTSEALFVSTRDVDLYI